MSLSKMASWKEDFTDRHIGIDDPGLNTMLSKLDVPDRGTLVAEAVPEKIRLRKEIAIPAGLSETQALAKLKGIAGKNKIFKSLIGMGYSGCVTPAVIQRTLLENPGWYTQYTPYQPEISQGRLESLLNFQTMVSDLSGLPIANASLLDESTAAAEAMALSHRSSNKDGSKAYFISEFCHPQTIAVVKGRATALGLNVIIGNEQSFDFNSATFGALLAYPNTEGGGLNGLKDFIETAHVQGALVTVVSDLLALVLLTPPGELGADIVVGNTQRFGVPLGYGGPHAAYFATKEKFKRMVPGRIVGVSQDRLGRRAYRLALQTREQHIRREKATSNICTAQALLANMAGMYAVYHGSEGLKKIANRVHALTQQLANGLEFFGYNLKYKSFFDTLSIELDPSQVNPLYEKAQLQGLNLRKLPGVGLSVSLDETCGSQEIHTLLKVFGEDRYDRLEASDLDRPRNDAIPDHCQRSSKFLQQPNFKRYRSETELMRYIKRLEQRDLSLCVSMIPLGSCTMKLNAASQLYPISWPEFSSLHPFAPREQAQGYQELFTDLEVMLAEVTGFDAVSLQPNSGAQGEYAGLLVIKAFHESRGESCRNVCLIPRSAHGTNPASAQLAGLKVVVVACDERGNIDVEDLRSKATQFSAELAALMVTYPSTHGVFEESIVEICEIVHANGAQVYLDGANLNAQIGQCAPGEFGADVCHLNLHKTFAIPHGGGGPGVGPIAVKKHLKSFLPGHPFLKSDDQASRGQPKAIAPISGAPFGSAGILPIPWMYMKMLGGEGLKKSTEQAILSANYLAMRLSPSYEILYRGQGGRVAHECIIDIRPFKASCGIDVSDVAKRLIDYSFHAPTMAFPVAGTLMIEPTESESLSELDRFCDAMLSIRREINEIEKGQWDKKNNPLKNAPHPAYLCAEPWDYPYPQKLAFFPTSALEFDKFWPSVSRLDEAYGDRNFACTCGGVDEYTD